MPMAYALATLAAFANALSSVFQRIGVQNAPSDTTMSWALIRHAIRHVIWFAGLALIGVGFLLQAVALRFGQLSSVQPIVTTELLFLVLILGVWFRYHLTWRSPRPSGSPVRVGSAPRCSGRPVLSCSHSRPPSPSS